MSTKKKVAKKKGSKKKVASSRGPAPVPPTNADDTTCFVVSPIGAPGTPQYAKFKDVLDYVIKPAVENSGFRFEVVRADDIDRAGSFIKDILQNLYESHIVIADLTGQNPNVFYELGVRHALSARTIMIAQSVDDIPSDLREYRTIVYDTSAKGAAEFAARLQKYLLEISKEPERPDNPVLDRIGYLFEQRVEVLEAENQQLKNELASVLKKGVTRPRRTTSSMPTVDARLRRIMRLVNAERQLLGGNISRGSDHFTLPSDQGAFNLYFVMEDGKRINDFWYLATHLGPFSYEDDLADARVLMELLVRSSQSACTFIIATNEDLSEHQKQAANIFEKMKRLLATEHRSLFKLEFWDQAGLLKKERQLGLKF